MECRREFMDVVGMEFMSPALSRVGRRQTGRSRIGGLLIPVAGKRLTLERFAFWGTGLGTQKESLVGLSEGSSLLRVKRF